MQNISDYWGEKVKKAQIAKIHTKIMENKYSTEISDCIKKTKIYDGEQWNLENLLKTTLCDTKGTIVDLDSVSAIFKQAKGKTAVLNFADYKHPGGCFLDGSMAQEESLCHSSFLYNVLKEFSDYYKYNNQHLNRSLYKDRALYSSDVIFELNGDTKVCDVITCAAPYKAAAQTYCKVSDEENTKALKSRIKFVLDIAEDNNVETLILGAYGSGVFRQNPNEVASVFRDTLNKYNYHFKKVIFAIPKGKNNNFNCFKKVFLIKNNFRKGERSRQYFM